MTTAFHQPTLAGLFDVATSDGNGRRGQTRGKTRKQERHSLLRERRVVYVRRGQRALLARLLDTQTATADDVYESVELPPIPTTPICYLATICRRMKNARRE